MAHHNYLHEILTKHFKRIQRLWQPLSDSVVREVPEFSWGGKRFQGAAFVITPVRGCNFLPTHWGELEFFQIE